MKHAAIALALLLLGPAVQAEQVEMPLNKAERGCKQACPTRGMTMAAVKNRFGEPTQRRSGVGDPPISRWLYDDFIVYFENNRVLHTVAKR